LDLPQGIVDPVVLGPDALALSAGLGVAAAVLALGASLTVFLFERTSSGLSARRRLPIRAGWIVLLVVGASLAERALLVHVLGVSPLVASMLVAACVVLAVLAGARRPLGAVPRRVPASLRRQAPAARPAPRRLGEEDWGWVIQLVDLDDMTELQHFVVEHLADRLHARGGAMLLADASGSSFELTYSTIARDLLGDRAALPADAPLVAHAAKHRGPILRRTLEAGRGRASAGVLDDLDALHAELAIPLVSRGRLLGIVVFGRCLEADGYADAAIEQAVFEAELIAAVTDNVRIHALTLQEKFRADVVLEQIGLGVVAADHSGSIVVCNRAARQILALGKSPEGRPITTLGTGLALLLASSVPAVEHGEPRDIVLDVKGRGEVPVRVRVAAVRGPLDAPGRLLLIEDLSERRALESELRGARRLASVGTLAAEMAHEIRNPLVSIKTFSQLLPERLDDRSFQLKFAEVAQREVDAISRIIDRLLNYAGPTQLERRPTSLELLAREVLELLSPELHARHITVETDFAPDAPPVIVDADKIRQVLRNVVANAEQAMPAGGRLRVTTAVDSEAEGSAPAACRMVIADTGCGIPKDKLAQVFDPFYSTRQHGFGLGLSLARHVMEEHGGSIEIDSRPGRSTRVTLTFALASVVQEYEQPAL
jgi:signal transduction histidine kinase